MKNVIHDVTRYRNFIKNWWISLLLGILFIAVGILVFFRPGESYLALSVTFGIMVVVSGILEIYIGANTPAQSGKGWLIAAGIIEVLLGLLLWAMPDVLLMILPFILGFWLMFRGFTTIGFASDMLGYGIKGAGWTLFLAILVVICSFFILANPILGVGFMVIWLGVSLVLAGVALIVFSIHLNRLKKYLHV